MLNVGTTDRIVRAIVGAILVALPFFNLAVLANPILWWGSIVVGVVLIVTAAVSFCPIYYALGLRTRPQG